MVEEIVFGTNDAFFTNSKKEDSPHFESQQFGISFLCLLFRHGGVEESVKLKIEEEIKKSSLPVKMTENDIIAVRRLGLNLLVEKVVGKFAVFD